MQNQIDDYQATRESAFGLGGVLLDFGDALDSSVDLDDEIAKQRAIRNVGIGMAVIGGAVAGYGVLRRLDHV